MEYPSECESEKKLSAVQEVTPPPPPHPLCDVASVAHTEWDSSRRVVQSISNELWMSTGGM